MIKALQKQPLNKKMHEDQEMKSTAIQNENEKTMNSMPKKRYVFGILPHQFETHNHLPNSKCIIGVLQIEEPKNLGKTPVMVTSSYKGTIISKFSIKTVDMRPKFD